MPFGMLIDDMFVEDGDEVPVRVAPPATRRGRDRLRTARDLAGPGVTTVDALTAVGGVLPAIEIVDSRIADWRVQLADTVADNASAGRVVLGSRITPATAVDLRLAGMLLYRNGSPVESGAGAAALGNPVRCLSWLANRLLPPERGLRAGDIVLSRTAAPPRAGPPERHLRGAVRAPRDRDRAVRRGRCGRVTDPRAIADALITAQRDRRPIAPFSSVNPFLDADTAYKAQALVVEHRLQAASTSSARSWDSPAGSSASPSASTSRSTAG